jgi:hypothetical protein
MLRFSQNSQAVWLIFLFLGVYAYLTLNEKYNYSRYPIIGNGPAKGVLKQGCEND